MVLVTAYKAHPMTRRATVASAGKRAAAMIAPSGVINPDHRQALATDILREDRERIQMEWAILFYANASGKDKYGRSRIVKAQLRLLAIARRLTRRK